MRRSIEKRRRARRAWWLIGLVMVAVIPLGAAAAAAEPGARPVAGSLEAMTDVLARLESELAALEHAAAERLEDAVEETIELLESLLDEMAAPSDDESVDGMRARILRLDLRLHRLVHVLEEIVEGAKPGPARPRAKRALGDLRGWIDGTVDGATAGLSPREATRFEAAAHGLIRSLSTQLADLSRRADRPDRGHPALARWVERLEALLFRLDGYLLQQMPPPSRRE